MTLSSHSPTPRVTAAPNMATQVMNHVRDCIHDGTMSTGNWYSVYQLSEELGISRSPVRDGLLRLEEAGLIEFVRNRGFRIVESQPSDVADIFGLRLSIEPNAAARAARDRSADELAHMKGIIAAMEASCTHGDENVFFTWDQELHDAILAAGHARRGRDILSKLRTHTRLLSDSTVRRYRSLEQVHSEHLPIIEAIAVRDSEAAHTAMAEHITATGRLLLEQAVSKKHPEYSENELSTAIEEIWQQQVAQF